MTVAHSTLSDSELHENKGVAAATDNTVATASSGATVWQKVGVSSISTSGAATGQAIEYNGSSVDWRYPVPQFFFLSYKFTDISTASTQYIVVPQAGTLTAIYSVIQGALSVADATLSFKNGSGTTITNGGITVTASGSAAGDIDSSSPSANNTFTAGQSLQIISDGGSTNTVDVHVTFKFTTT